MQGITKELRFLRMTIMEQLNFLRIMWMEILLREDLI